MNKPHACAIPGYYLTVDCVLSEVSDVSWSETRRLYSFRVVILDISLLRRRVNQTIRSLLVDQRAAKG